MRLDHLLSKELQQLVEPCWTRVSFGWFAHGWNVGSGALVGADESVCVGALLGFEVTGR